MNMMTPQRASFDKGETLKDILLEIRDMEKEGLSERINARIAKESGGGRPSGYLEATNTVLSSLILSVQAMLQCSQSEHAQRVKTELQSLINELSGHTVDTPFDEDDAKRFIEKWNAISQKLDTL